MSINVHTIATFVLAYVALSTFTYAQPSQPAPFGIRMGAKKSELVHIKQELPNFKVVLDAVPKPHPDLESYVALVTPQTGVCYVKGIGKTVRTSVYGSELRSTFDDLRHQLEGVYGPGKVVDSLKPGSIWNEPKDFMMGLVKSERFLIARWTTSD